VVAIVAYDVEVKIRMNANIRENIVKCVVNGLAGKMLKECPVDEFKWGIFRSPYFKAVTSLKRWRYTNLSIP